MRFKILAIGAACVLGVSIWAGPAAGGQTPKTGGSPSPQRQAAGEWVSDLDAQNLRGACEMQAEGRAKGLSAVTEPCSALPTSGKPPACPKASPRAKPPYRKSEIRTKEERVGEFTEETAGRGFVRINAQVKASRSWGTVGLEQVEGSWRITYLRFGEETFSPAGNVFQAGPAYNRLWISNWCRTDHPQWEQNK